VAAFAAHEDHPEAATLAAYHARELRADAADEIAEHLAACSHCASLVLDLDDLMSPAQPRAPLADPQPESERRELRGGDWSEGNPAYSALLRRGPGLRTAPRWMLGTIAALLVLSLGLGFAVVQQAKELAATHGPQVASRVATLRPEGSTRGVGDELSEVRLPSTLILPLPGSAAGQEVEVELRDAAGARRWSGRTRPEPELVNVQLLLPAGSLAVGSYVIEVRAVGGETAEPLARFALRVAGEP
jgi:hypothetical protein